MNRFWKNDEIMVIRRIERIFLFISLALLSLSLHAQEKQEIFDFMNSDDYIVGGVSISGIRFLDTNALDRNIRIKDRTGDNSSR